MESINITNAVTHPANSIFAKKYTVKFTKLYEIQLIVNGECQAVVKKRYREIRQLFETISSIVENKGIKLPKFPEKSLFNMSSDRIDKRKNEISLWMNDVLKVENLSKYIYHFFNIKSEGILNTTKKNDPSDVLKSFVSSIGSSTNNKINLIEKFSWTFFSKKLQLKPLELKVLIECLVPLCGDEFIGNKSLDFLCKLLTSDYHRDFIIAGSQFVGLGVEVLQQMQLNQYLTKNRLVDSQIQAYNLSKILHTSVGSLALKEILNNDEQAFDTFINWESSPIEPKQVISSTIQDWRPLFNEPNRTLSFRFVERELYITGFFNIATSIQRTIEYLTVPSERKKWDLRMQEMIRIQKDNTGYIIIYAARKKLYEFHIQVEIEQSETHALIQFATKCYEFKRNDTIFGNMNSSFKADMIQDLNRVDDEGRKVMMLKVEWNARFCENSFSVVREDIFQEANLLQKSFEILISELECKNEIIEDRDGFLEKFERKKLTKTFSM